jgi:hypothetical protein
MSSRRLLLIAVASIGLAACNTAQTHIGDESAVLGEAFAYDMAIQTINPAPVYGPNAAQPGSNGDVGAAAVKRYRSGQVKQVQTLGTSSVNLGGSGSSSGPQ